MAERTINTRSMTQKSAESKSPEKRKAESTSNLPKTKSLKTNIAREWMNLQMNGPSVRNVTALSDTVVSQRFKYYQVFNTCVSFMKRITCLAWEPSKRYLIAGSRGGELALFLLKDDLQVVQVSEWEGLGPGYSVLGCAFSKHFDGRVFLANLEGSVTLVNIERSAPENSQRLIWASESKDRWFCSVAVSPDGVVLAGCNKGGIHYMDKSLTLSVNFKRSHTGKINSIHFDSSGHTFATASGDHTVKVWDLRNMRKPLNVLQHDAVVNSAYFRGPLLLSTDQRRELRIYSTPSWNYRTICHPHRQSQTLTPIRASWHPKADLVLVGRHPDRNVRSFEMDRVIDVFSASSGKPLVELQSVMVPEVTSLVEPDPCGEVLACGTGRTLVFWKYFDPLTDRYDFGRISPYSLTVLRSSGRLLEIPVPSYKYIFRDALIRY